ncbi:MAG: replication endonuclease [Pseudomonadota bacterium]
MSAPKGMKFPIPRVLTIPPPDDATLAERITWRHTTLDGEDRRFRKRRFEGLHESLSVPLAKAYSRRYESEGTFSANTYLRETLDRATPVRGVPLGADDEQMKAKAAMFSQSCDLIARSRRDPCDYAASTGIELPVNSLPHHSRIKRLCCPRWWFKRIRKMTRRAREQLARELGRVGVHREAYATNATVFDYQSMQRRNEALLSNMEAVNTTTGEVLNLGDLNEHSLANPRNRFYEMIVRVRGFQEIAESSGHEVYFVTLTCPSRFHPLTKRAQPNPRYRDATAREANDHLCRVFARLRAYCHRHEIHFYGIRVVEPHQTGTPHWHFLLFAKPDEAERLTAAFQHYALELDGDEPGASTHRLKIERIDPSKGDATGYIAKYLAKNIDDSILNDLGNSVRIRAWSSLNGIRQFQFFGGPPVGLWRELRHVGPQAVPRALYEIAFAADSSNWASFVSLLGGPFIGPKQCPVTPLYRTGKPNRYGDPASPKISGLKYNGVEIETRPDVWEIRLCAGTAPTATIGFY